MKKEVWSRKTPSWRSISTEAFIHFLRLTLDELTELSLSCYQIKQAQSYTEKHVTEDGSYELFLHWGTETVLRVEIQSRNTSTRPYNLWIEYNTDTRNRINSWYCQCKVVARTVGCCAHVASVLWYLGYYQYNDLETRPCQEYGNHLEDAAEHNSEWSEFKDSD